MKGKALNLALLAFCLLITLKAQRTSTTRGEIVEAVNNAISEGNVNTNDRSSDEPAVTVAVTETTDMTRDNIETASTQQTSESPNPIIATGPVDAADAADDLDDMADDLSDEDGEVVFTPPGGQPTVMDAGDAQDILADQADNLDDQADDNSDQDVTVQGPVNADGGQQLPQVAPLSSKTYILPVSLTILATCAYLVV